MPSILILGRQPALGLAELESLYGADEVKLVNQKVAKVDVDPCLLAYDRLGGSVKFAKLLSVLDTTDWNKISRFLIKAAPDHSQTMPSGKMYLGISSIDFNLNIRQLQALGLSIKKAVIKSSGRSVRYIPNKSLELNAAQVIHNKLTSENGWELILIKSGNQTYIAQTVKVQDIEGYARRDQARPKRDSRVGMLPPKLAQIILNLSVGILPAEVRQSICDIPAGDQIPRPNYEGVRILDPFCGSGVILQEALLMGYKVYGSDIEPRMISYAEENIDWLNRSSNLKLDKSSEDTIIETADATTHEWKPPISFVASEVYLGRPFNTQPIPEILEQTVSACNVIIQKFLENIRPQLKPSTRLCLAVPAWRLNQGQMRYLSVIDRLTDLGYNLVNFEHVRQEDLIYYRTDQIVARQLIVITRI